MGERLRTVAKASSAVSLEAELVKAWRYVGKLLSMRLLRLLPAGAVAWWDLHPLESAAFSRRHPSRTLTLRLTWGAKLAVTTPPGSFRNMVWYSSTYLA
jgi:hypothetical protein